MYRSLQNAETIEPEAKSVSVTDGGKQNNVYVYAQNYNCDDYDHDYNRVTTTTTKLQIQP